MSTKKLISAIDVILKPLGFVRKGMTWNRRSSDVIDIIDVQISKLGETVTLNAGVLDIVVYLCIWDKVPPVFVEEPFATVRIRIGDLLDHKDKWWKIDQDNSVTEILSVINDTLIPFFDRLHRRDEMAAWLDRPEVAKRRQPVEILARASLMKLLGQGSEACEFIELQQRLMIGNWRNRFKDFANRLGC